MSIFFFTKMSWLPGSVDKENLSRVLQILLAHFSRPFLKQFLCVELLSEIITVGFELLPVNMGLPAFAQHSLDSAHVHVELTFDLFGPNHGASDERYVAYLGHSVAARVNVLGFEFLLQVLDVVLDSLYELGLVLANGTAYVRTHEQRVESRENSKHLVGVLGSAELIAQTSGHASLDAFDSLVVASQCGVPQLLTLVRDVQCIHFFHFLVR